MLANSVMPTDGWNDSRVEWIYVLNNGFSRTK